MEEKKTVMLKKEEFTLKEFVKKFSGKGKVSKVRIEYTPMGEKVIISTHKPGIIIGSEGSKISELTNILKNKFKLENLHIEIEEIIHPEFDAQINADEIALGLERFGPLKFKVIAYRALERIIKAGALGVEIRLNGKLPGSRARSWRFAQGYLKKTGESAKVVDRAQARAETKPGTIGIKVAILSPYAKLIDKIEISEDLINKLKEKGLNKKPAKNKAVSSKLKILASSAKNVERKKNTTKKIKEIKPKKEIKTK